MRLIPLLFLLSSVTAEAAVYKCVVNGKTSYTDQPCNAAAEPARLPPLNTIQREEADDLAKAYDERLSRNRKARDAADADFLRQHAAGSARDKAVRTAIIAHRVIDGMTASEVQSAMGSADEELPDGSWRYRRDGQRITVSFRDGRVSGLSTTSGNKKK